MAMIGRIAVIAWCLTCAEGHGTQLEVDCVDVQDGIVDQVPFRIAQHTGRAGGHRIALALQ